MSRRRINRVLGVAAGCVALVAGPVSAVPAAAAVTSDGAVSYDGAVTDLPDRDRGRAAPPEQSASEQSAGTPESARGKAGPRDWRGQVAEQVPDQAVAIPELQPEVNARAAADRPIRRTGVVTEEYSRAPDADSGLLLSRTEVTQDLTRGVLEARASFRATPSSESIVRVVYGEWDGGTCRPRAALLGAAIDAGPGAGSFYNDAGESTGTFAVSRSRAGQVVTLRSVVGSTFRTAAYDCTWADVLTPDGTSTYQESKYHDLDDVFPPRLQIDLGDRVQGNYRGKWTKMRIEVYNASQSPAPNVTIRPRGAGLKFKPKVRSLGTIDRRSTKYGVEFRVRLKGKKPKKKQRKATFVASSGGASFTSKVVIAEKPKPKKLASLAGRYYWGFLPASASQGWDNRALWFVNRKWVHVGFAKNGKPPKCSRKVKACSRYTYNKRKGIVRFGGRKAKVTSEGFAIKASKRDPKIFYYPTKLAKRGQRFNVALMRNDFTGFCGIWCSTSTQWFSLDKKGRFVLSGMSISSLGPPGVGTIVGSVPPDERGTYKVGKRGRVVLSFANGKKERHTLAIEHDVRGKPSPAAGLILGDRNFYRG